MATLVESSLSSATVCGTARQRSACDQSLSCAPARPVPMADITHPASPCPAHDDLGVSVGWEASYEGWPVSIRQTKNRGRIVVATRDIKPGEIILRSMHYTCSVSEDWRYRVCSSCWKSYKENLSLRCTTCDEVAYCDEACKAKAEHYHIECEALKRLHQQAHSFTIDQYSEIRMIIKMFGKAHVERKENAPQHHHTVKGLAADDPTAKFVKAPLFADVCRLVANGSHFPQDIQNDVARMSSFVRKILPDYCHETEKDIGDLFYRERCNCFGIWDTNDYCLASAIFPVASFFNHSCVPNCTRFPDVTGVISIRALYPIPAGNELTISYITLKAADTVTRRAQLESYYTFVCGCHHCRDETPATDAFMETYLCKRPECTGLLVPEPAPSTTRVCRICPYRETYDPAALFPPNFTAPHQIPHQQVS